jgi:hypothetical protein
MLLALLSAKPEGLSLAAIQAALPPTVAAVQGTSGLVSKLKELAQLRAPNRWHLNEALAAEAASIRAAAVAAAAAASRGGQPFVAPLPAPPAAAAAAAAEPEAPMAAAMPPAPTDADEDRSPRPQPPTATGPVKPRPAARPAKGSKIGTALGRSDDVDGGAWVDALIHFAERELGTNGSREAVSVPPVGANDDEAGLALRRCYEALHPPHCQLHALLHALAEGDDSLWDARPDEVGVKGGRAAGKASVGTRRAFARAREAYVRMHAWLRCVKRAVMEWEGVSEQM